MKFGSSFIPLLILSIISLNTFASVTPTPEETKHALATAIKSNDVQQFNQFIDEYQYSGWEIKAIYYRDKIALELAKKDGSEAALTRFIDTYPDSGWFNNAVYYRDKIALELAKKEGSEAALKRFLEKHPDSAWFSSGVYHRDRVAYYNAKSDGTLNAYNSFLRKYPNSEWKEKVEKLARTLRSKENKTARKGKSKNELSVSQQRTRNALAIYEIINRDKRNAEKIKQKAAKEKQSKLARCYRMKDRIRSYDERKVWYELDKKGDRQYLTDNDVKSLKQKLAKKYRQTCS
ncbi:MAG: hypothetical protein COA99_17015 [Moraxellaceae bacterium]|nr:MAG: hypothetical protein COA99_17015 [Moraxellaceae bacterium]